LNPLLAYFKFWWHSTNEHGVHSPFVFDLVTKCFYDRTNHTTYQQLSKPNSKSKFLIRLSAYFKFESCFVPESISENFEYALNIENKTSKFKTIEDLIKTKSIISKVPCLIYVDAAIVEQHSIENLLEICHRDSMILVDSIRETQSQFKYWNQLKSASEISVSIDTFYWGLLFLRTAQPKEHFTIRL
jgi:hypothetical protein